MATSMPGERLLTGLFNAYLSLVARTARMQITAQERIRAGQIIGYWHEDSASMLVLLRRLAPLDHDISVIITADWRGNILEGLLKKSGASALRVEDGLGARHAMGTLRTACGDKARTLASALDGPLGPRRESKRLLFHLAGQRECEMLTVHFAYSKGVLRLRRRWDHYAIPLPFCRMDVRVESLGVITKEAAKSPALLMHAAAPEKHATPANEYATMARADCQKTAETRAQRNAGLHGIGGRG